MIVKSTDTVRDIIIGRAALFNLESRRFAEEIKRRNRNAAYCIGGGCRTGVLRPAIRNT